MKIESFEPHGSYLLVSVPLSESKVIIGDTAEETRRHDWIAKGKHLLVDQVGADCKFAKTGEYVMVRGLAGVSKVELETGIFYIVRESDILGKIKNPK